MTTFSPLFCFRCLLPAVAVALVAGGCDSGGGGSGGRDGGTVEDGGGDTDADTPDGPSAGPDGPVGCSFTDVPFSWPVETEPVTITPSAMWKNRLDATFEPFAASTGTGENIRWVKFTVLVKDPSKVYFQDSRALPLHYDFVSAHLDPYLGRAPAEIDAISLEEAAQELILGAVLFPPGGPTQLPGEPDHNEMGVQIVRRDPYHPEMIDRIVDLVAESVDAPAGMRVFYMPTFEQSPSAEACAEELEALDVEVGSVHRWLSGGQCYASGWALGRLVQVPGGEIDAAYASGDLTPADILLTDQVPAEVPFVAGIIALEPATPSSHVAILARSYQIPFAYLADEAEVERTTAAVGKWVALEVAQEFYRCDIRIVDVDGKIPPAERDALLDVKDPPDLEIDPIGSCPTFSDSTDDLGVDDIGCYGGKASHFGILRDAIPDHSPQAVAISFRLWLDFLDQSVDGGSSLGDEVASRLAGLGYPEDIGAIQAALSGIRSLIRNGTEFDAQMRDDIIEALASFDPNVRLRFRSSTNVEDSDHFVGAGLYDSVSGCLADDLDDDDVGPSRCNEAKPEERGVLRAIRKVFASFYNDNAYLERLRHGVDEAEVGMALLVHPSFPDEIELANGVATVDAGMSRTSLELVSQPGATSVANPSTGAVPEIVLVDVFSFGTYPAFEQASSLLPLGENVLVWDAEYLTLTDLLLAATDRYREVRPGLDRYLLDLEYKKVVPGDLVVKQIRPIPIPDSTTTHTTYLVDESTALCVYQGEETDVFALHRLKSTWQITTDNRLLDENGIASSLYAEIGLSYVEGDGIAMLSGAPSSWPGASFSAAPQETEDVFVSGAGADERTFTLRTQVTTSVPVTRSPIQTIRDFSTSLTVDYATPVATIDSSGPTTTSSEYAPLVVCPPTDPRIQRGVRIEEVHESAGITIETAYYWPVEPRGIVAGYTAPLYEWEQTTITGLTSEPLVLTDDFAQTYRPEHHNFASNFIFDPWLDPAVSTEELEELVTADVRWIHVAPGGVFWKMTLDGKLVQLD